MSNQPAVPLPPLSEGWLESLPQPEPMRRLVETPTVSDPINQPSHYTSHPSGIECIQITEHMNFCLGNAIKYIWRAGAKGDATEDLRKARWYIDREIERLEGVQP